MEEEMDVGNPADEEENERKLLCDTSDDEVDDADKKIEDESEILGSDSGNEMEKAAEEQEDEDEDSDADVDDDDDEEEAQVQILEATIAKNPYDYEAHKLLIEQLHKMGELDRLRVAREKMSSLYPLTAELWLSWLRDEMKLAVTPEQKNAVIKLCERAVEDYLSVEVWLEYLQCSIGLGTEPEIIERIRILFERALTAAGLHVIKGALIWDAFREYENFLALNMDSSDPKYKDQINRIGKLYKRQLSCPLLGMEKTYEEYEIWRSVEGCDCTEDEKIIKSGYEKALQQLRERIPFEEKLQSSHTTSEQIDAYKAYLIKEKQIGDPGRVTVLYERAIADQSLCSTLWLDYLQYLETTIKINDIVDKVYIRAIRNVSWCTKIWQNRIRFHEKNKSPLSDVQKLMESALTVGFSTPEEYKSLWMTYLEYLRRRYDDQSVDASKQLEILRKAFNTACDHLATFGLEGDPSCEILQFWARSEAIHAGDMEKARLLWADIMSQGHSDCAASWLEYINLERCYGGTKHLRKLFQKALASVKDWPESIANAWINFERDEGTLEQMEICETKTKERLEKVAEERQKSQEYSTAHDEASSSKKGKRKAEDGGRWKNLGPSAKLSKVEKSPTSAKKNSEEKISSEKKSKVAPPPGYEDEKEEKMEEESHNIQPVDENITIFVSNLDYTATEEEIQEALKSVGPITLFRMVKDYKGRSKGFCYVQLTSPEAVEEALKLDRTRINGRPMFISRCDPNKSRGSAFKYKTELEKNKLFIKGLPVTMTEEQLKEMYKVYPNLKDVRIVTYRNGHSKGFAYVEFTDEQSAAKALVATDGMTIEGKVISVAISQPPQRKQIPDSDDMHTIKSLGGTSTSRSTFGNPKTVLSLIPRTVKQKSASSNGDKVSGNGVAQTMSNDDFRNMLLKKK